MMRPDSFAALRYRDFRLLWLGEIASASGAQMRRIAIAWHIYQLTHDPIALGLLGVVRVLPLLIFSLAGGLMADALDRRKVLVATQSAMMVLAALLAALTFLGMESAPLIYVIVFLTGVASSFDDPARQSLVPNLVPRQHVANAFSLNSIIDEVSAVVGAGAGGIVIAGFGGVGTVYALNALSYLATIGVALLIRPMPRARLATQTLNFRSLLDGARYIRNSPVIRGAMLMDFFATFFGSAATLLPIVATDMLHVGAEGYGILSAAPSIGSILAGGVMSVRSGFRRPGRVMLASVAVYGLATTLFGISSFFVLSFVFFALTGAGDTVSMILRQTIRQLSTPDSLRGRMTAINNIFASGGPQLGDMEAGIVAALWGAPFAIVSGGVGCLLAVLLVARLAPALREFDGLALHEPESDHRPPVVVSAD